MISDTPSNDSPLEQAQSRTEAVLGRVLAAAQPGSVFSAPVESNGYTVITASEVMAAGGFGSGQGSGSSPNPSAASPTEPSTGEGGGAGGGGFSSGRPVAAIVISRDGVTIRPILDTTKLLLAAIATWASIAVFMGRVARRP